MHLKNTLPAAIEYLGSQKRTVDVVRIARQLMEIRNDCNHLLPGWFVNCRITNLKNGTLSISVPNQALAARLRQRIPFLQNQLSMKGWSIDTIRVKVLITPPEVTEKPVPKKTLPPKARESFSELYEHFKQDEHSHSQLCEALRRLISRHPTEKNNDPFQE